MLPAHILETLDRYDYLSKDIYNAVIKSGYWSRNYSINILEGSRFLAGEPAIFKSPEQTYQYIVELNRYSRIAIPKYDDFRDWPEAREVIMKSPGYAFVWARDEIQGRWPEAEPYIAKDGVTAVRYAVMILQDRFPEAEENIKKLRYSVDHLDYRDYVDLLYRKGYDPEELGFG